MPCGKVLVQEVLGIGYVAFFLAQGSNLCRVLTESIERDHTRSSSTALKHSTTSARRFFKVSMMGNK